MGASVVRDLKNGIKVDQYTFFLIIKTSFCLSLIFVNIMLKITAEIFLIIFLTFISLFSLIVYLVRFSTINKPHFLTHMLTRVSNFKQEMLKFAQFCNFKEL